MMGSSKSKTVDPAVLELANKYRFPTTVAKNIKQYFGSLDTDSKGLLTKDDFRSLLNQLNPLSDRVLDAFFYPPDDLDPEAEPMDTVDLEHFFKMFSFFFHFPMKMGCRPCKDIFTNPRDMFKESKIKKRKRLMILFRMIKATSEAVISKGAFAAAIGDIKIGIEDGALDKALLEIEKVSGKSEIDFIAFKKLCSKYQIDDIFVHEVRDDQRNQMLF